MARTDERVGKVLENIAKPHFPFNKSGNYELLSSQKVNAIRDLLDEVGLLQLLMKNIPFYTI